MLAIRLRFARKNVPAVSVGVLAAFLAILLSAPRAAAQAISFAQVNAATPQSTVTTATVPFLSAQTAGDLNVVVVGWNDATAAVSTVTDTVGNVYVRAVGPTVQAGLGTQSIYYAANIGAAAAGANTVTVTFNIGAVHPDVRIAEYRGLAVTNPVDVVATGQGASGTTSSTSSVTTTNANDVLVGANLVGNITTGPGTSFTTRLISNPDSDIIEDRVVSTTGSYNASAAISSGPWIMQMVAFKGQGSAPDLTLTKTHAGAFSQGQTGATYTLTASNGAGAGSTSGTVTVTDTLPTGLTATALSGTGWTCTLASVSCTRSDVLPAAASYPAITLTVAVSATAPASVTNSATVSGGGDVSSGNNTATDVTTIIPVPANLTLTKTHAGNFTQGQAGAVYTLTASNVAGNGPTNGTVTVADTLPSGLTATALSGTGWTCALASVSCTRSDVLAAGAGYPAITLTVNVSATAPASVTNSASVSGGGDATAGNNTATDVTTITPLPADLTITKTHAGNFSQGQTGAAYTLTASNGAGAGPTSGTVTVADTLPTGLTATALSGTGWTCTLASVSCTRSDVLAAGASYPAITLTVNVAATAPASVTNTASVSGGGDSNAGNNTASDATTITPVFADLTIAKTHAGSFTQGQTGAAYTLTASNLAGSGPTSGTVTVADTLPTGLTATALSGTGWTCTLASVSCTRSDVLAAGASYPAITLTVNVAATAPATVTNTASVSGGGDVTPANNSASDATTVIPVPADLTIIKTHVGNFTQGQTGAVYTLTASNLAGAGPTNGAVTVADTLPTGLTATALSGTGWTCTLASVSCTRSDLLAAGASYPAITLTVNVAATAPASVTNTATVSGGGDSTPANNTASDVTTVSPSGVATPTFKQFNSTNPQSSPSSVTLPFVSAQTAGDLNVVVVGWNMATGHVQSVADTRGNTYALAVGPTVLAGTATQSIYYAANIAAAAAGANIVTVTFDQAVAFPDVRMAEYSGIAAVNPVDVVVAATGNTATSNSGTVTTTNANDLLVGANIVQTLTTGPGTNFTQRVITSPDGDILEDRVVTAAGSYSATAPVSPAGGWIMQMVAFTAAGSSAPPADLTITKTHAGAFSQGQLGASYTLTVANGAGAGATSGTVTVTDTLPTGLIATALSGTGWSCTLATLSCTRSDVLAAGAAYPAIALTVNVSATAPASVINTANVSGGGDVNAGNNTASDATTIIPVPADLTIIKTHAGNFSQGQTGAVYTLTASNAAGNGPTSGTVTVADALPSGLTVTAISGSGWTCSLASVSCTRSDVLAAGASYPAITLTVNVSATAPASVTNSASVSGGGDVTSGNNTATDATTIIPVPADLTIIKTHTGNFSQGQTGAVYTLTASNLAGNGPTSGTVTVADTLPSGLTATAISGTGWTCALASISCTRSDALAAGASYPAITLTVNVSATAPASVTNTASVSGGGDTTSANNSATDVTTVTAVPADLTIIKTHAATSARARPARSTP